MNISDDKSAKQAEGRVVFDRSEYLWFQLSEGLPRNHAEHSNQTENFYIELLKRQARLTAVAENI